MRLLQKMLTIGLFTSCAISLTGCAVDAGGTRESVKKKPAIPNEPLFTDIYFADPSAHVFEDKLYIYPSHDIDSGIAADDTGDQYDMRDYHVISVEMGKESTDHGVALKLEDVPWASQQLWAPDAACRNGKYYLFFPAKDKKGIFRIGVAVSDSPTGPFTAEKNYIDGSFSIDPAVFMDSDDQAYLYFGGLWGGQLENWQNGEYDETLSAPAGLQTALGPMVAPLNEDMVSLAESPQEIQILDKEGNQLLAREEDKRFFEGAWVHKYNGKYYLSYSTGTTHTLVYATSDSPVGPFTFQGKILDPVKGWTTHHSIVEYQGKWYLFYHDASLSGRDNLRTVKFAEIHYNSDGTIQPVER